MAILPNPLRPCSYTQRTWAKTGGLIIDGLRVAIATNQEGYMGQTVLVCGGRDYDDIDQLFIALDLVHAVSTIDYIIHGCAKGADTLADCWAKERSVPVERYPALWDVHGRGAGPIRNQLMLDDGKPDLVVAFNGGRGTADMVRRAEAAGVRVALVPYNSTL